MTTRRAFLEKGAVAAAALAMPKSELRGEGAAFALRGAEIQDFELNELGIVDLSRGLVSGKWTSQQLVQKYMSRIQSLDHAGPSLHAMIELNPDAESIATRMDRERADANASGRKLGPMHGIPVLIKDNIDTADRMHTSAGSLALADSIALRDAFIVERLRDAGAIIIGKTNLSEWANFRSSHSSSGWSGRGGQARNPYVLDRSPCGSSSGTGVGIAASYAAVGVGTETDGSIVCPSSACGLVGIKPTLGLVSRSGIIPIAHSQDTAGPMARTVTDAAILLNVLAGVDKRDVATITARGAVPPDYMAYLKPDGLRGARIGVARAKFFGYSADADRLTDAAIDAMRRAGAIIVDPADIPHASTYDDTESIVLNYEFKADINKYLAGLGPNVRMKTLKDLIAFNEQHRAEEMPYFGQESFIEAQSKGPLTDKVYTAALAKNHRLSRGGIDEVMTKHKLDALVAPTGSPTWPIDLINGDHFTGASSTPAAVSGYPSISVPIGFAYELPVGISFIGRAWSEGNLISLAYGLEQTLKARRAPRFIPTAPTP